MPDSKIVALSKEIIDINAQIDELTKRRKEISKQLQKEISNNAAASAINLSDKVGLSLKKDSNASPH